MEKGSEREKEKLKVEIGELKIQVAGHKQQALEIGAIKRQREELERELQAERVRNDTQKQQIDGFGGWIRTFNNNMGEKTEAIKLLTQTSEKLLTEKKKLISEVEGWKKSFSEQKNVYRKV